MVELCISDCEDVGGGVVPLLIGALFGVSTLLGNAGAIYDFTSGILDGFNNIH